MGYYINPSEQSKEQFLQQNGSVTTQPELTETHVPVCLVNNGFFTVAAICYSERELNDFNLPEDNRPKTFYQVPREVLRSFCNCV